MSITNVPELFGSMVFNDTVMKERLPKDVYKKLKKTMREGTAIDADVAAVVATAMKDWAKIGERRPLRNRGTAEDFFYCRGAQRAPISLPLRSVGYIAAKHAGNSP